MLLRRYFACVKLSAIFLAVSSIAGTLKADGKASAVANGIRPGQSFAEATSMALRKVRVPNPARPSPDVYDASQPSPAAKATATATRAPSPP